MTTVLDNALTILRANAPNLRARGILHAFVFGSVARREERPDSDLDLMIDLDPAKGLSIYDFSGLKSHLSSLLGRDVDLVEGKALKTLAKEEALRERVDAF
jgi:predicted nucleotidyltransferase